MTEVVHCVESVHIRSCSGPHFPAFGLNKEISVSLCIHSEWGEMQTRITPNTDTFYAVCYHVENISIDLPCKSVDWFLYNKDLCQERVNLVNQVVKNGVKYEIYLVLSISIQ